MDLDKMAPMPASEIVAMLSSSYLIHQDLCTFAKSFCA